MDRLSDGVSADTPDWSRERRNPGQWDPGRSLLAAIRDYQEAVGQKGPIAAFRRVFATLRHRLWSVVSGADIPLSCRIGGGMMIPHPNGIVIHPDSIIGPNCMIFQQVTVGQGKGGVPTIGGHVDIGAGAKIIGNIVVGDHAAIGANAVVLRNVPRGATAVGIPARIIFHAATPGS
jgi:serine O-acetyltransferase